MSTLEQISIQNKQISMQNKMAVSYLVSLEQVLELGQEAERLNPDKLAIICELQFTAKEALKALAVMAGGR